MPVNYDKIATNYDWMSRFIFGRSLIKAQVYLLQFIPSNSNILIVGGGTGWILDELTLLHSKGLSIYYIESSANMIALSKKRNLGGNDVHFIHLPIENYSAQKDYDVILTPFLFDNFQLDKIQHVFNLLHSKLKKDGLWLYADFVYNKEQNSIWQKILLKTMYIFFKVVARIETQQLVDMSPFFLHHYKKIDEQTYYKKFIRAIAYKKMDAR